MLMIETLVTGDLVAVAYSNIMRVAIFRDFGLKGNPRFWFPQHVIDTEAAPQSRLYCIYLTRRNDTPCIAKIHPDVLKTDDRLMCREAIRILTNRGEI